MVHEFWPKSFCLCTWRSISVTWNLPVSTTIDLCRGEIRETFLANWWMVLELAGGPIRDEIVGSRRVAIGCRPRTARMYRGYCTTLDLRCSFNVSQENVQLLAQARHLMCLLDSTTKSQ